MMKICVVCIDNLELNQLKSSKQNVTILVFNVAMYIKQVIFAIYVILLKPDVPPKWTV